MAGLLKVDTVNPNAASRVLIPGHVVQTVQQPYTTTVAITSTSYTATGLTASITPTSTSSKILVLVSLSAEVYQQGTNGPKFFLQILRGSTEIAFRRSDAYAGTASNGYYSFSVDGTMSFLDEPSTASAVTYTVNGKLSSSTNNTNLRLQDAGSTSSITLMEIAG